MNDFERGLREVRARHRRGFVLGAFLLGLAILVTVGLIAVSGGTPIRVEPAEASIDAEVTVTSGLAIEVERVIYSLLGAPAIAVHVKGFQSYTGTLSEDQIGRPVTISLTALPGVLAVTTVPGHDKTRWRVDGSLVQRGAVLKHEVAAGTYGLEIDNPYFVPVTRELEAFRGETTQLAVDLTPVEGSLDIRSTPEGAEVSINGEVRGRTPVALPVAGGSYEVRLTADGFNDVTDTIEITHPKPTAERSYRLRPVSATLTVDVSPAGGELLLSGRSIRPGVPVEIDANTPYTVTYVKEGYHAARREVLFAAKADERIAIELEADIGAVEISSEPTAGIYVDGKRVGRTPATLKLPAKRHRIELRKPGYRTVTRDILPSSRRVVTINETLRTEASARLAEAKPEYTNSAGVTLKLFQPDDIRMGAPRHQKGQRTNEFEKDVTLRRPFYAGKHEVTNAQFGRFRPGHRGQADLPVVSVSWFEAAAFANWLSAQEGLTPFYRFEGSRFLGFTPEADGYRLLTEAEWEWLARKAGKDQQTVFSWGDDPVVPKRAGNIADEAANGITEFYVPNYRDGYVRVAPVASYPPEASGLYDLTGNVSEWTHDYYSLLPPGPSDSFVDPLGPATGDTHVVKGASWRAGTRTWLRAAYRDGQSGRRNDLGFRVGRYLYAAESGSSN